MAGSMWAQQQKQSSSVFDGSELSCLDSLDATIATTTFGPSAEETLTEDSETARLSIHSQHSCGETESAPRSTEA